MTTAHQEAIVPRNETMLAGIGKDEDETLNNISFVDNFPEEKRKAVVRKIDWRLPPFLACLYRGCSVSIKPKREALSDT